MAEGQRIRKNVKELVLPKLEVVNGPIFITGNQVLDVVSMPMLLGCGTIQINNNPLLTEVELPSLVFCNSIDIS